MSQPEEPLRALVPRGFAMRRRELLIGAAGLGMATLLGCGSSEDAAPPAASGAAAKPEMEDTLNLFSWADYSNPESLKAFTADTGAKVVVDVYDSNEAMIAKLQLAGSKSGYDIIVPTGPTIPGLVKAGLVQKLDKDLLPNLANVDPAFLGQPWDPNDEYAVIKAWGATGYVYDRKVVGRELTSWADFFTAAAQDGVSGKVSVLTAPSDLMGLVFWRDGIDWTTEDKAEFDRAEKILEDELLPHLKSYLDLVSQGMLEGTIVLGQAWNGDARRAVIKDPERFAWTLPTPETEVWVDNWAIVDEAPHPVAAHAFINAMLDPEMSAREIEYIGYNTAIRGTDEFLPADLPGSDIIYFTDEEKARLVPGADNAGDTYAAEAANRLAAKLG